MVVPVVKFAVMKKYVFAFLVVVLAGLSAFAFFKGGDSNHSKSYNVIKDESYPIKFELKDADGNEVALSQFSGKVVVLNFWASWCRPCAYEMPALDKFNTENSGDDLAVVAVALDRNFAASKNFMQSKGYSIPYYQPAGNIPSQFGVSAIPVTFVINPKGEIISTYTGMTDFGAKHFQKTIEDARQ